MVELYDDPRSAAYISVIARSDPVNGGHEPSHCLLPEQRWLKRVIEGARHATAARPSRASVGDWAVRRHPGWGEGASRATDRAAARRRMRIADRRLTPGKRVLAVGASACTDVCGELLR